MTRESDQATAVALVTSRLHDRFPLIQPAVIEQIVTEIYVGYDGCRLREFIPLLVERESRDRVGALPAPHVSSTHVITVEVAVRPSLQLAD